MSEVKVGGEKWREAIVKRVEGEEEEAGKQNRIEKRRLTYMKT